MKRCLAALAMAMIFVYSRSAGAVTRVYPDARSCEAELDSLLPGTTVFDEGQLLRRVSRFVDDEEISSIDFEIQKLKAPQEDLPLPRGTHIILEIGYMETAPPWQRQGFGQLLLAQILAAHPEVQYIVTTLVDTNLEEFRRHCHDVNLQSCAFQQTPAYKIRSSLGFGTIVAVEKRYNRTAKKHEVLTIVGRSTPNLL